MKRKIGHRKYNKAIFIVCQGKVTEYEYFNFFKNKNKIKSLDIKVATANESNALDFVKYAIYNYQTELKDYDEFWLVFDKDETSDENFNFAINFAERNKCKCAYSNQAFEIWFIHHYKQFSAPLDRHEYSKMLKKHLGFDYTKDKSTTKRIIETIYPLFNTAIKNSELSYKNIEHTNPASEESSTTVFQLAKSIKEFIIEKSLK